jgi:hypothetical protein
MEAKKHDHVQGEKVQSLQYDSKCVFHLYLGLFNISYIIFKNVENFKNHFLQITKYYERIFHLLKWKFQN